MGNDVDDVDDAARARQHEQAERVEEILTSVREDLGDHTYPTTSEELSARYGADAMEVPNETESLGSAFRRLDETFEDEEEAYNALVTEFEQGKYADVGTNEAGGQGPTWSGERVDEEQAPADEEIEGDIQRSEERARRAQAEGAESESDAAESEALQSESDAGESDGDESDGDESEGLRSESLSDAPERHPADSDDGE